jgi:hypothetical protein
MTRTVYVPASRIERWLATYTTRHGAGPVSVDGRAVVVAGTDGATARLSLHWPGLQLGADPLADLLAAARVRHRLGILAVRADGHALGIWDGAAIVGAKRKGHYVQARTAAGGWSQQRFARRRENQAKAAYESASGDVAAILEPVVGSLDGILAAGNPAAITAVLADHRVRRTAALAARVPLDRLELHATSREALTELTERFLSVVIGIDEPGEA